MARRKTADPLDGLDDSTIQELDVAVVVRRVASQVQGLPDRGLDGRQKSQLLRALEVVERAERLHGGNEQLFTLKLMILGKAGRFEEAIGLARRAYAESPDWATAITAANALRRAGDREGAAEMFRAAARHDPADVSALLDLGDLFLEGEQWEPALKSYEEALGREKGQPWAVPSAHYCRYRLTGDKRWLRKLRALAEEPADECGVAGLLARMMGGYAPDDRRRRARELLDRCGE